MVTGKSVRWAKVAPLSKVSLVAVEVLNEGEHAIRDLIETAIAERLNNQTPDTRVEVYDTVVRCLPDALKELKSP